MKIKHLQHSIKTMLEIHKIKTTTHHEEVEDAARVEKIDVDAVEEKVVGVVEEKVDAVEVVVAITMMMVTWIPKVTRTVAAVVAEVDVEDITIDASINH
jgi:hypothetical protein